MAPRKSLHGLLRGDATPHGLFVPFPSPPLVEIAGGVGFDFVIVDTEHGSASSESVENMIRAADAAGIDCVVRVPRDAHADAQRAMDAGAAGILAPHVVTAADARDLVAAAHYPPRGRRGYAGTARSGGYGLLERSELLRRADQVLAMAQIEDADAVDNLDEIAAVPGLDVIFIGPADLAMSVGKEGAEYERYLAGVIDRATTLGTRNAPLVAGCFARDAAQAGTLLSQGIGMVALSTTAILVDAFRTEHERLTGLTPAPAVDGGNNPNSAPSGRAKEV